MAHDVNGGRGPDSSCSRQNSVSSVCGNDIELSDFISHGKNVRLIILSVRTLLLRVKLVYCHECCYFY
jgi:hypothetical protein